MRLGTVFGGREGGREEEKGNEMARLIRKGHAIRRSRACAFSRRHLVSVCNWPCHVNMGVVSWRGGRW